MFYNNVSTKRNLLQLTICLFILTTFSLISCKKNTADTASGTATEDSSSTGVIVSAIGGAISNSDSNGTTAFYETKFQTPEQKIWNLLLTKANASTSASCPTIKTANGAGCSNVSNDVNLTYNNCSFGLSAATWSGTHQISLSTGAQVSCGTFPNLSSFNGAIQRQFVTNGTPGSGSRTNAAGVITTIDHATANLNNKVGDTVAANIIGGGGYGSQVFFDGSGHRTGVIIKQRVYNSNFDHGVDINVSIDETTTPGKRLITSGTAILYHNKIGAKGTTTFSNLTYDNTCCQPISGTITTTFSCSSSTTPLLCNAFSGKSETLTISGCGTATLVDTSNSSKNVTINSCL